MAWCKSVADEQLLLEQTPKVEDYFLPEVWAGMGSMERQRCDSQLTNYRLLLDQGLLPRKPDFLVDFLKRKKKLSSGPPAPRLPHHKGPGPSQRGTESHPSQGASPLDGPGAAPNMGGVVCKRPSPLDGPEAAPNMGGVVRKWQQPQECSSSEEEEDQQPAPRRPVEEGGRRYPRRNVPQVNYFEPREPDDDEYIMCPRCGKEVLGKCPDHGQWFLVVNTPVPKFCKDRARRSVPGGFEIRESSIPGAGQGVFLTAPWLPDYCEMGPYEGVVKRKSNDEGYCWQLKRTGRASEVVDAADERYANWARYMNCARHRDELNAIPYQYAGNIWFRVPRQMRQGDEVLTYYGPDYMRDMGIDVANYCTPGFDYRNRGAGMRRRKLGHVYTSGFNPLPGGMDLWKRRGHGVYPCHHCKLAFSLNNVLLSHVHGKHNSAESLLVLQFKASWVLGSSAAGGVNSARQQQQEEEEPEGQVAPRRRSSVRRDSYGLYLCPVSFCTRKFGEKLHLREHIIWHLTSRGKPLPPGVEPGDVLGLRASAPSQVVIQELPSDATSTPGPSGIKRSHSGSIQSGGRTISQGGTSYPAKSPGTFSQALCVAGPSSQGGQSFVAREMPGFVQSDKKYQCQHCVYSTDNQGNFYTHQRRHTGEKPHQCEICEKRFSLASDLKRHINDVHSKAVQFPCSQCPYVTTQKSTLTRHLRTHSGERPYACRYCDYATAVSGALQNHLATHTGEKRHSCPDCGYSSITTGNMESHIRTNHGEGMNPTHVCTQCGAAFVSQLSLSMHMGKAHKQQQQ